jgi:hypothetical protein
MRPTPSPFLLLASLLALLAAAPATRAQYFFTLIADSSSPIFAGFGPTAFGVAPAINAAGTVAFYADLDGGGSGIFTGLGGVTTPIALTSGIFNSFERGPAINLAGTVAFRATLDTGGGGVFTGAGGPTTTISTLFGSPFTFTDTVSINADGMVGFGAGTPQQTLGIYKGNGGAVTTIATDPGPSGSFSNAVIDGAGNVFFRASDALRKGAGGALTLIDTGDGSSTPSPFGDPSVNAAGTVAYYAHSSAGDFVFSKSGNVRTTHAVSGLGRTFAGFALNPAINGAGKVAFEAALNVGGTFGPTALYVGNGGAGTRVIGSGDPLFGSTVSGLVQFGTDGFNDVGQLAFGYTLADGRTGIAVANPGSIPEPSSELLVAASGGTLLLRRRARS